MSLVNDALRKARREAAERDAEARGATYRPPRAHLPPEPRNGLLVGLVVGLVLAFGGTGVGWYFATRDRPQDAAAATATAAHEEGTGSGQLRGASDLDEPPLATGTADSPALEPPAADLPEPKDPGSTPVSRSVTEPPSEPAPLSPVERASTTELPAATVEAEPSPAPAVTQAEPEPPEPTSSPPPANTPTTPPPRPAQPNERARAIREPARTGRVEPDVYVLEADLDDTVLHLDFIIYSPTAPFAQINGEQVSPGQLVDGWSVVSVDREQVLLRRGERDVVLRVR